MVDSYSAKIIPNFLTHSAQLFPDKTALLFEKKRFTYKELDQQSDVIANYVRRKTKKQDRVALLLSNSPEFIVSYFGILKAGCIVLLIQPNISDENLIFQIKKTNPKIIISEQKYKSKLERSGILKCLKFVNAYDFPNLSSFAKERNVMAIDLSTILFTSGTTSKPKGIALRHKNVVGATKNIVNYLHWKDSDVDVNISQLSHSFGLGHIHCVFAVGGTVVLFRDAINLKKVLLAIIENKATTFSAVPAVLRLIVDNYASLLKQCGDLLRFVQTNTSPLEEELIKKILTLLPKTNFCYYYGLTEASRATFITFNKNLDKLNSVGRASPNVLIKIVDRHGKKVQSGELGEICIHGNMILDSYWKNKKASQKIKNGWIFTGDFGYMDKEGFLFFKGRKDDIINVSGEKVPPEEIEEVIKKVKGVLDVAVIGIKDRLLGEVPKAFVVGKKVNFDGILEECRKKLEFYKVPRHIEQISEIPRTSNGKVRRSLLRDKQNLLWIQKH